MRDDPSVMNLAAEESKQGDRNAVHESKVIVKKANYATHEVSRQFAASRSPPPSNRSVVGTNNASNLAYPTVKPTLVINKSQKTIHEMQAMSSPHKQSKV